MKRLEEIDIRNLDELENEMRERDQVVSGVRAEMAVLKKHADVLHIAQQTEAAGRAPQVLTQGVNFELGGKQ